MNTNDIVRDFIAHELLQGTRETPLGDQDQLIESGIVDSMGIMTLLGFLEEKFSLQIPGDDLIPENFASIATITALIDRRLGK